MDSEQTQLTVETLNRKTFEYQAERKRFYKKALADEKSAHAQTQAKLDKVIEQNAELIANSKQKDEKIDQLLAENKETKETLDLLINMNIDDKETLDDVRRDLNRANNSLDQIREGVAQVRNEVGSISVKDQKMLKKDYLIIYASSNKPAIDNVRTHSAGTGMVGNV